MNDQEKIDAALFRRISPEEEATFRRWARENFHPGDEISPVWHPVVRAECDAMNCEAVRGPITILDVALARGAKQDERGGINGGEFERLGLPLFGGCQRCGASLAAYNMCPSTTGFVQCRECIGDLGFATVEAFEQWCRDHPGDEEEGE